jgi:hypothetical protein
MEKLSLNQKAVKNLQEKGINARIENGTIYVVIDEVLLELSEFEIKFQADEFCKNQPISLAKIKRMITAANHLLDNYGKKSYRERLKGEYNDEFGYTAFSDVFHRVQSRRKAKHKESGNYVWR